MANETRRYQLTNCTGQISPIHTEQDLSQYLGTYVSIQGSLQCYLVSEVGCGTVKVTFTYIDTEYSYEIPRTGAQNGFGYYELNIPSGPFNQIKIFWDNTPANPSDYGWRIDIRSITNDFSSYLFSSTNECPLSDSWDFYQDGSEFEVDYISVGFATPEPVGGCECIKVTYTLVGEEPVTVEVESSGETNGKNRFNLTINDVNYRIAWVIENWIVDSINGEEAYSLDFNPCPFGIFTILEGSIFEAFEVEPCGPPLEVISCYQTCEECSTKAYLLYSCTSQFSIQSTDPRLEELNSDEKIIRIPFYQDGCFRIEQIAYDRTRTYIPVVEYSGVYDNCLDCYPKETVEPLVEFGICDPQKVIDIKCDFAEMMYQQMMSRRLGIEFCCPIEKGKATLKNDIIDFALLPDELPDLPEPYVEYCCIPITTDNCPPVSCSTCTETVVEVENCNCTASENSPHPCHTYQVTVLGNQLLLAAGNTNGSLNGKVYFAYFKCKATKPTIVEYTTAQTNPYCVLGIPVFGYYTNNEWVNLPLTRGEECPEEEITNTCCNG
jgi:hypothetical protein